MPAYLAAGRQAGQRYATSDAVALCARALELLPRLAASRERDLLELAILGTMCRQVSSNSFSAAFAGREPLAVYGRALELARSLGDPSALYAALTQRCNYHMITAQYDHSAELTSEMERIEQAHTLDPAPLHAGLFARAYIAFFSADLGTALRLLERLTPPEGEVSVFHDDLAGRTLALGHLACVRWVVGEPERALAEALATIRLAEKIRVPILLALGHVVRGRVRFLSRDPLAASEPMLHAFQQRLTEVSTCSTLVALVLIDVLLISGHASEARRLTDDVIVFARAHNETVYLPELLRVRGEQCLQTDTAAAIRDYRESIDLARATGARSLEQRALESLAAARGDRDSSTRPPGAG